MESSSKLYYHNARKSSINKKEINKYSSLFASSLPQIFSLFFKKRIRYNKNTKITTRNLQNKISKVERIFFVINFINFIRLYIYSKDNGDIEKESISLKLKNNRSNCKLVFQKCVFKISSVHIDQCIGTYTEKTE